MIYFLFSTSEETIENEIKKVWVSLANNPADLTEDKIKAIEGAMNKILQSNYFTNDDFWEDLIKEAIEKAGVARRRWG